MLSATQADALIQLQAKLDAGIASAGAQSSSTQTMLFEILDIVRALPQMASAVESISNKIDKLKIGMPRPLEVALMGSNSNQMQKELSC